jgi:hypothetical protein
MSAGDCSQLRPSESVDETSLIVTILSQLQNTLAELDARVNLLNRQLEPVAARKEWYSIAEAAAQLSKADFTVREWCRLKRVNAHKRECGRGGKREWMIAEKELERIRNKGLLPTNL